MNKLNKLIDMSNTDKKSRVSVMLPKQACLEIRQKMLKEGYSLREKSKWYSEAIASFLELNNFHQYVEMASEVDELSQAETIYIPKKLEEDLEDSIIKVRKKFPALEGVKSLIIRASIVRRLLLPLKKITN